VFRYQTGHHYRGGGPPPRRFPPRWSVEEQAACFVVRDHSGRHSLRGPQYSRVTFPQDRTSYERLPMSKQRRTADDFVRDMKAKQQHSTPGDIERKTSEALIPEQAGAWRGNRGLTTWPIPSAARRNTPSRRSISRF